MNLSRRAKQEAVRSCSAYHFERSEMLRDLGQPTTSSEARGKGVLVNLQPRAKREATVILIKLITRAKREDKGSC